MHNHFSDDRLKRITALLFICALISIVMMSLVKISEAFAVLGRGY